MQNKPIRRHKSLQPISHEHHYSLQLCWKIRIGLKKNVDLKRIEKYALWFYINHLLPHFNLEEEFVFPLLGQDNDLILKAKADHKQIKEMFDSDPINQLEQIAELLEKHIRFEERILFNEIQLNLNTEQLFKNETLHSKPEFKDNTSDAFWL